MTDEVDIKLLFKNVVRQIHPDLFAAYPFERARNSESLKVRFSFLKHFFELDAGC